MEKYFEKSLQALSVVVVRSHQLYHFRCTILWQNIISSMYDVTVFLDLNRISSYFWGSLGRILTLQNAIFLFMPNCYKVYCRYTLSLNISSLSRVSEFIRVVTLCYIMLCEVSFHLYSVFFFFKYLYIL